MASKIDLNTHRGVWVFVEQTGGEPAKVSLEMIGKGREIADKLKVTLSAFLIGESVSSLAEDLVAYGADNVIVADDPVLKEYRTESYADIICKEAEKRKPEILIIGATPIGRDLAPRLSFRLTAGCTADCTHLDIDEENRLFVSTRPAFGGNVMATIICPEMRPQMATVRPGVMPVPQKDQSRKGEIIHLDLQLKEEHIKVKVLENIERKRDKTGIQDAQRIVAIGLGAKNKDTFDLIKELADPLNASIAGSRLAVEAGWISHDYQVGQTGKTVKPDLYIGCGISGAIQHTAGMNGSKTIVAINSDPNAEIFKVADYGIVGDVKEVVVAITKAIESL